MENLQIQVGVMETIILFIKTTTTAVICYSIDAFPLSLFSRSALSPLHRFLS